MRALLALALLLGLSIPSVAQGVPVEPHEPEAPEATPPPAPTPAPAARPPSRPSTVWNVDRRGPRRLGGPRTGFTVLSASQARIINERLGTDYCTFDCDNEPTIPEGFPVVSQFGWQFERRMFQSESGLTGMTELVLLVGGVEHGVVLPSGTFLAGVRLPSGVEFGVGPSLSLAGAAYALAVGVNNEIGDVNVPLNLAVVLGQDGPRASLLVGFNVSDRRY